MDALPNEILVELFMHCPNAWTSLALSSTSRRFRAIYKGSEQSFLSFICRNQIHPAVLPIAVDIYEMRKSFVPGDRVSTLAFLATFPETLLDKPTELTLKDSKELLKFHRIIEHFIDDYVHTCCTMLNVLSPRNEKALSLPSTTEYVRLARAFYRIELYEILFREPRRSVLEIPAIDQCNFFLRRLKSWELGELLCVRDYLKTKLQVFWNQLEDYALDELLANWPEYDPPSGPDSPFNNEWMLFSDVWRSSDGRIGLVTGFFGYRLSEVRKFLKMSRQEEFSDVFETYTSRLSGFEKALQLMPRPMLGRSRGSVSDQGDVFPRQEDSVRLKSFKESYTTSNPGWAWNHDAATPPKYSSRADSEEHNFWLMQCGYCIWDYSRFRNLHVLMRR